MKHQSKKDDTLMRELVEFLEKWNKLASLIAGIVSVIFFIQGSWIESLITLVVGWIIISAWLFRLSSNKRANTIKRYSAILGVIFGSVGLLVLGWFSISEQIRRNTFPIDSVDIPQVESTGISVYADIWESPEQWNKLDHELDTTKVVTLVDEDWKGANVYRTDELITIRQVIIGQAKDEQIRLDDRVPLRITAYEPIGALDVLKPVGGGGTGADAVIVSLSIPVSLTIDKIMWASYSTETVKMLAPLTTTKSSNLPNEIQRSLSITTTTKRSDTNFLADKENFLFSIALQFSKSGIYYLQSGAEYIYKGKKSIAWADPPFKIIVLDSYSLWQELGNRESATVVKLIEKCSYTVGNYKCEEVH